MTKDIDKMIEATNLCIPMPSHGSYCHTCPYASEENCTDILADDVAEALKRLKFLEKPTGKEQPKLPGIDKCPE